MMIIIEEVVCDRMFTLTDGTRVHQQCKRGTDDSSL